MKPARPFEAVCLISLPGHSGRLARATKELKKAGIGGRIHVQGVAGAEVSQPAWWRAGAGAFGCYLSHLQLLLRMQVEGWESMLVVEDDAVWRPDTAELLPQFMAEVPADWGQLYLGGQHRKDPEPLSPRVYRCQAVNRTHAYAVHRRHLGEIIGFLLATKDFLSGSPRHVDHQLESGHRQDLWPTYAPTWWLAGQGENLSTINGRQQPDHWWHHVSNRAEEMPVIMAGARVDHPLLYFGPESTSRFRSDLDSAKRCPRQTRLAVQKLWQGAAAHGRLPAVVGDTPYRRHILKQAFPHLIALDKADLTQMAAYPGNGLFRHPWLDP